MKGVSIRIAGLRKAYGHLEVVRDINFDIKAGEFVALLGPSGSGKSTILMCIAGFVEPSAGVIEIGGQNVTALPPRLRNIGMVFQKYALFPHMSVAQNIAFPLLQRGVAKSEINDRIAYTTKLVGLGGLESRPVPTLSGGQQQRVALARALVFEPPVLLMDEPLGALDKKLRERLQVEIKEIQRVTGTTVVFVTHDQSEALGMADRLVVLNHGAIEQIGTPSALYEKPQNPFVADFIGEANFLDGLIDHSAGKSCWLRLPDGNVVSGQPADGNVLREQSPARIMVRPNHVQLHSGSGTGLVGRITSSAYFGESTTLHIQLADGPVVTAKEPSQGRWGIGQRVCVSWETQHAIIFNNQ
jgi:ABC-type Fe3+/spermidine/putrescine transport system ATPase subunit